MVNLGPQLVQLMKGYPNRRSAGSASSRRQSAQVAVSADTRVLRRRAGALATMVNDLDPLGVLGFPGSLRVLGVLGVLGVMAVTATRSMLASGGASRCSDSR